MGFVSLLSIKILNSVSSQELLLSYLSILIDVLLTLGIIRT